MTDNRTTELREKLDALGVEHYDTEHMTEWHDVRGLKWNYFSDGENTDLTLETPWEGCTPGQAVAATLGWIDEPDGGLLADALAPVCVDEKERRAFERGRVHERFAQQIFKEATS